MRRFLRTINAMAAGTTACLILQSCTTQPSRPEFHLAEIKTPDRKLNSRLFFDAKSENETGTLVFMVADQTSESTPQREKIEGLFNAFKASKMTPALILLPPIKNCRQQVADELGFLENSLRVKSKKRILVLVGDEAGTCLRDLKKEKRFEKIVLYEPIFGDIDLIALADHYAKPTLIMAGPNDPGESFRNLLAQRNIDAKSIPPDALEAMTEELGR